MTTQQPVILYVEDDPQSRKLMSMLLKGRMKLPHVTILEDSKNFLVNMETLDPKPDVILLDIHMKPYTGFDMLKMIRSHAEYDRTYVVALTASVMNEEVRMLQDAGFQGGISKPLHLELFGELIQRIMTGERVWHVW